MFTWKFKLRKHIGHKAFKYEDERFNVTFSQWDMGYFCCLCVCVYVMGDYVRLYVNLFKRTLNSLDELKVTATLINHSNS